MKIYRVVLFLVAIFAASYALFLSTKESITSSGLVFSERSVSIDSAQDGGAAGFAILSGLALVAASITFLKK